MDVASSREDVTVYIGTERAETAGLTETVLIVRVPQTNPGRACINGSHTNDPCVVVSDFWTDSSKSIEIKGTRSDDKITFNLMHTFVVK